MSPTEHPGVEAADLHPAAEPEDTRYIRDVDTLRALSDPTRMRILETMVQRTAPAWSVKELAASLGMPQTRLYHHVELLLERGLVRPVERRVVSGIIETRYAVAARSFQLDRGLFAGDTAEGITVLGDTLRAVFDTARDEIELAVRSGSVDTSGDAPPERRLMLQRGLATLSAARATEFRERLAALVEEYGDDEPAPDAMPWGLVLAVYPLSPAASREPTDG